MKKITWRSPRIVATVGVACVMVSSPVFQASWPLFLSNASRDWPGPPPATKTRLPSMTGEAALFQPMLRPAYSAITSFAQHFLPLAASKQ